MKDYSPEGLIKGSRYRRYLETVDGETLDDIKQRISVLTEEEKEYCDKGNHNHMANILPCIAIYQVLQEKGMPEEEVFKIVSEEMWKVLDPSSMQKLARYPFFMPLMKRVVPMGFKKMSGVGWRYTWFKDDPKDRFHFECNECIYAKIFAKRGLQKLGPMFCHADVINYGNLPYTDFIRTQTLCRGGEKCDFDFVRHKKDEDWERHDSV